MSLRISLYENNYGETRAVFAGSDQLQPQTKDKSVRCHSCCASLFFNTISLPVIVNEQSEPTFVHFNRSSICKWGIYFSNVSFRASEGWDTQQWVNAIKGVLEEARGRT